MENYIGKEVVDFKLSMTTELEKVRGFCWWFVTLL